MGCLLQEFEASLAAESPKKPATEAEKVEIRSQIAEARKKDPHVDAIYTEAEKKQREMDFQPNWSNYPILATCDAVNDPGFMSDLRQLLRDARADAVRFIKDANAQELQKAFERGAEAMRSKTEWGVWNKSANHWISDDIKLPTYTWRPRRFATKEDAVIFIADCAHLEARPIDTKIPPPSGPRS